MFVLTVKSKVSKKAGRILVGISAVLCAIIIFVCAVGVYSTVPDTAVCDSIGQYSTAFESEASASSFAKQFGKEIEELYSTQSVYIPSHFNETYIKYNELQKKQGLDLEKYKGRQCTLYVYKLKNYTIDYSDAYLSVAVYRDAVIAGHISTGIMDSVMYTFCGE